MHPAFRFKSTVAAISLVTAAIVGGYYLLDIQSADAIPAKSSALPQALPLEVMQVQTEYVRLWNEFSGHLTAIDQVDLRPQVSGSIIEIQFEDGQFVSKGDVLFVIDPRTYRSDVKQAKAELSVARQNLRLAKKEKVRAEELVGKGNISKRLFDERANTEAVAISRVNNTAAALEQAEIALDHAYVKAPISGRVSRIEITEGNFVSSGSNAPILTTIVATEEIYADFEVDEQTYLAQMHSTRLLEENRTTIPVELLLANGSSLSGQVHSFDNRIDPQTGTIRTRAVFKNTNGALLPGMFAKLRIGTPSEKELILLPPSAISTDQERKFVYILSDSNKVEYRQVTLGAYQDGRRVITSGLSPADRVVTQGILKIRPGTLVEPKIIAANAS
ncbi:efflux RND transporter periplasmic adaptor subunit [Sneathiella marina]|uniref:Efflux RND transporter periplasmic adaptor subunit n=1 Tax=Sneathiella marina TaxID=2950108 RepID=A0ABY4W549_9PROT|nr:efflux RND transporter periplasmic adaptor subunit [Sneathiella marina]USG62034.1 efflux RND transporter periplasmic adaptor subunit [Sneathiella marina]